MQKDEVTYQDLFGIRYCVTDYAKATERILQKAKTGQRLGVSALAVHGLIESYDDPNLKEKVNAIDMVVPDGQPIRWALNYFFHVGLKDRVYGPTLSQHVLAAAAAEGVPVFFYGSTSKTLELLAVELPRRFNGIQIAGFQADRFRDATPEEKQRDIDTIKRSGARIVFVGRGCPRQERWVAEHADHLSMPLLAVGAAFDFLAGNFSQAPGWMQRNGLEWLYRFMLEPRRLWRRYLYTNSKFMYLCMRQFIKKEG